MTSFKLTQLAGFIFLAACASEKNTETTVGTTLQDIAVDTFKNTFPTKKQPEEEEITLTREKIDAMDKKLILATFNKIGVINLFEKTTENNDNITFRSPADITLTLKNGIIVTTHGLGFDLIAQSSNRTQNELFTRNREPVSLIRKHQYLIEDNTFRTLEFQCQIEYTGSDQIRIVGKNYNTHKYQEQCSHASFGFTNTYWVDSGTMKVRKSNQLTHPEFGRITIDVLN